MSVKLPEEYVLDIYPDTKDEQLCPASCRHCLYGIRNTPPRITSGYSEGAYDLMRKLNEYLKQGARTVTRINYILQTPEVTPIKPLPLENSPLALSLAIDTDPNLQIHMRLAEKLLENTKGSPTPIAFAASHVEVTEAPIDENFIHFIHGVTQAAFNAPVIANRIDTSRISIGLHRNDVDPRIFDTITNNSNWAVFREIAIERIAREHLGADIVSVAHFSEIGRTQCTHQTSIETDKRTLTIWGRYIKYEPPKKSTVFAPFLERAALSLGGRQLVLGLFPKEVWVGHSTKDTSDETVRFTYPEFSQILAESIKREASLIEGLGEAIAKRRE